MSPPRRGAARRLVIAIDGPGAAGKTTAGRGLAARLGYRFVDTGAMYRAVTLLALERRVPLEDDAALARLAAEISIAFGVPASAHESPPVLANGRDVTGLVYTPRVDRAVSRVSEVAAVRQAMVRLQRRLAAEGAIVMVGRDIGTRVLPNADLKVFLDASAEERARRRHRELLQRGETVPYETVLADLVRRDRLDSQRAVSPLVPASDARHIDSDKRTAEEVIQAICDLLGKR